MSYIMIIKIEFLCSGARCVEYYLVNKDVIKKLRYLNYTDNNYGLLGPINVQYVSSFKVRHINLNEYCFSNQPKIPLDNLMNWTLNLSQ